jgi:hypothetical protein
VSDVSPEKWGKERLRPKYMKLLLPPTAMGGVGDGEKSPDGHQPRHPKLRPLQPRNKPTKPPLITRISLSLSLSCPSFSEASYEPSFLPPNRSREETGGADGRQEKCCSSTMSSNPSIKSPRCCLQPLH